MKKKFKYIILILVSICLGLSAPYFWDVYHYLPFKKKEIHIFFENHATAPALSHIIEFSKLDKKTKKIIGWNRFPNRVKVFDLKAYNTIEVPMESDPVKAKFNLMNFAMTVFNEISQDPSATLVFHTSFDKVASGLKPLLMIIPKQRIKAINLYEDGYGDVFKWTDDILNQEDQYSNNLKKETEDLIKDPAQKPWHIRHVFGLREIYNVTYHFLNADKMKSTERFSKLNELLKNANVQNINFHDLSKTLTEEQKQIVYQLTDFDYPKFKELMSNKKSIMFVTGFHFGSREYLDAELEVLNLARQNKLKGVFLENPQEYTWFFKPHPAYNEIYKQEKIKEQFPDLIEISPKVPFEVFILAGLKPTLTAGFSSSLFFSLNENDVLFYGKRPKYNTSPLARLDDHYLAALLKDNLIRENQIILYEDYFSEEDKKKWLERQKKEQEKEKNKEQTSE